LEVGFNPNNVSAIENTELEKSVPELVTVTFILSTSMFGDCNINFDAVG
jgi:hypothetical protein